MRAAKKQGPPLPCIRLPFLRRVTKFNRNPGIGSQELVTATGASLRCGQLSRLSDWSDHLTLSLHTLLHVNNRCDRGSLNSVLEPKPTPGALWHTEIVTLLPPVRNRSFATRSAGRSSYLRSINFTLPTGSRRLFKGAGLVGEVSRAACAFSSSSGPSPTPFGRSTRPRDWPCNSRDLPPPSPSERRMGHRQLHSLLRSRRVPQGGLARDKI